MQSSHDSSSVIKLTCLVVVVFCTIIAVLTAYSQWRIRRSLASLSQPIVRTSQLDLSNAIVPESMIVVGGVLKDAIPALTDPKTVSVRAAHYLDDDDRVIGLVLDNSARAYPLRVLIHHEIINDTIATHPVAITYCPLSDSSAIFSRRREAAGPWEFGVSGRLYNNNVLMFDRGPRNESLWSQMMGQAVSGPQVHQPLEMLPVEVTTWSDWRSRYPTTDVLSTDTGHQRDYSRNPYAAYFRNSQIWFSTTGRDNRLPPKTQVLGVWTGDSARAFPITHFRGNDGHLEEEVGGQRVVLKFNPDSKAVRVAEADDGVQWIYAFWFAWYAFQPHTDVWQLELASAL